MLFRESFITDKGAELLARATAQGGQIVWTTAKTSDCNTDGDSASTMNHMTDIVKTEQDSYTSSGSVTNAIVLPPSATDDGAQSSAAIFCELTNETYDGLARTFGAWAKIQGDQTDVLAIVARCGTGVTPTYINPVSEGLVKAFVDFTLKVSAEQVQTVQSAEGYYATATALNTEVLARETADARMVTTHSANDLTTGDAQTILGNKTFSAVLTANGGITTTTLSTSGNSTVGGTLQITGLTEAVGGIKSSNLVPRIDANPSAGTGYDLGSSSYRWYVLYAHWARFSGPAQIGGTLSVTDAATLSSTLSVTGNTTIAGTLGVTGATTLTSLDATGGIITTDFSGSGNFGMDIYNAEFGIKNQNTYLVLIDSTGIELKKDTTVTGKLNVTNDATLQSNLSVTGNLSVSGEISSGLLSVLYGSGKGAIVRIHIVGTTTGTFARGSEIYDGYSGTIGSLTVTSDEYTVTSASRFRLLHKTVVTTSGVDADAVVTVA